MDHTTKKTTPPTVRLPAPGPAIAPEPTRVPLQMPEPPAPRRRPVRWLYWMAGVVALIAVGITLAVVTNEPDAETPPIVVVTPDRTMYGRSRPFPAAPVVVTPDRTMYGRSRPFPAAPAIETKSLDDTTYGRWPTEALPTARMGRQLLARSHDERALTVGGVPAARMQGSPVARA